MILINVRFKPLPENVENFRELVKDFTDWYRNEDNPDEYLLIEAFQDDAAEAHVNSEHFKAAQEFFPTILKETPTIINTLIEGKTEWDQMAEFKVS